MQIGIVLPIAESDGPGAGRWTTIREIARHAEARGLDSLWAYDHLLFRSPDQPEDGSYDSLSVLMAVAASTERIRLGTIVLGTGFRSPGITARMAATLDEISEGRVILGLGVGWHEPEYEAFGIPFDHRVGRFEEFLAVTLPLLRGERVTFSGQWHQAADAVLLPPPPRPSRLPGQIPILIAAKGDRVLDLVARHADAWNAAWFGLPDERYTGRHADLLRACERVGRDPGTLEVTVGMTIDAASGGGGRPLAPSALPADATAVAAALDAWRDLGVGHVQVDLRPAGPASIDLLADAMALHRGG
jgi:probable F420-dependent oxidoreductase